MFRRPQLGKSGRDFVREVIIVIVGVLVALALEQVASNWRDRVRAADIRASMDEELSDFLTVFNVRAVASRCIAVKLDAIDRALAANASPAYRNVGRAALLLFEPRRLEQRCRRPSRPPLRPSDNSHLWRSLSGHGRIRRAGATRAGRLDHPADARTAGRADRRRTALAADRGQRRCPQHQHAAHRDRRADEPADRRARRPCQHRFAAARCRGYGRSACRLVWALPPTTDHFVAATVISVDRFRPSSKAPATSSQRRCDAAAPG